VGPSTSKGVLENRTNHTLQPGIEPRFLGRPDCSLVPAPTALSRPLNILRLNLFNMCVLQGNRKADLKNTQEEY
jgi:hypothetical protein